MPLALLLAMQAAGMVVDWWGSKQQVALSRMGTQVELAGINANIAQNTASYEEDSLAAMKELRQNLGTQAAYLAAKGTRGNAGSALVVTNQSISRSNADERMRRMNMLSREGQLRANKTLAQLHQAGTEQDIWNSFAKRTINRIPTSTSGGGGGDVYGTALSKGASSSFGLTST